MPYAEDDLETLTEYRDGIIAALEKANDAIADVNAAIDRRDLDYPRLQQIETEYIKAVESARLSDRDAFEQARAQVREYLGNDPTYSHSAVREAWDECDTRLKQAHRYLEEYLAEEERAERVES